MGLSLPQASLATANYQLDFDTNVSWIYFDQVSTDKLSSQLGEAEPAGTDQIDEQRTFGLEKASLSLSVTHHSQTKLSVKLRPDAWLTRNSDSDDPTRTVFRDIDLRAGDTYRANPVVELLDTYELALIPSQNFKLRLGVLEDLEADDSRTLGLLEFGLNVRLPKKLSVLSIAWANQDLRATPNLRPIRSENYAFELFALQGRDDRSEGIGSSQESYDTGPVAKDPFVGGAISLRASFQEPWSLLIHYGYLDTKVNSGRRNEHWLDTRLHYRFTLLGMASQLLYQAKWTRDRWSLDAGRYPELEQRSHRLHLEHASGPNSLIFWALSAGHSDQLVEPGPTPDKTSYDGQQLEIGWIATVYPQLQLEMSLAFELRDQRIDGQTIGGFAANGDTERSLNRFALRLNYQVSDD